MSEPAANNEMWACQHCADTYASMPDRATCFECGEALDACVPLSRATQLQEALELVLPMAKGWAALHNVGSNRKYVEIAEAALAEKEPS